MFTHVVLGADDLDASKRFYDAALGALGVGAGTPGARGGVWYSTRHGTFGVVRPLDGGPASGANGGTVGFAADSAEAVEAWHAAGLTGGGTACEDPPGPRQGPAGTLYLAYLRDPSGNKLCALHRAV